MSYPLIEKEEKEEKEKEKEKGQFWFRWLQRLKTAVHLIDSRCLCFKDRIDIVFEYLLSVQSQWILFLPREYIVNEENNADFFY